MLSPSGSVDGTYSAVGYTSDELSILSNLFAIRTTDALSKSITGDTFLLSVFSVIVVSKDLTELISFDSLTLDATILLVSCSKFSPSGMIVPVVAFVNEVSVPDGLVALVPTWDAVIVVFGNSKVFKTVLEDSHRHDAIDDLLELLNGYH